MVVHGPALLHDFIELKTAHEHTMFMNKVIVHEQNKFMNSGTFMCHVLFKNIHEPFMNPLINIHERSYYFCFRTFMNYS